MQDYDRKQAELARRKENISKQHELGYLTTEQLTQRMAAILREESQLPVPIQRRWSTPQDTADMIRSLGEQWRQASKPHQRVLRYQLASALLQRLYVDLAEQRVVGIQFRADLYLPARHMLEPRGWQEHEPGVLWNQQAPLPIRLRPDNYDRVLHALETGCQTSAEIARATGITPYGTVNVLLRHMLKEGIVTRERVQREGREFRYALLKNRPRHKTLPLRATRTIETAL
jgi:hypothetical protein